MILHAEKITSASPFLPAINALAKEAFPPEEYLSPSQLIDTSQEDGFDFWSLQDGDLFVGFLAVRTYQRVAYLFFLAIDAPLRSHGYGSHALQTLRTLYPGFQHVVDFEMLDDNAPNHAQREKRRQFYLRNGYQPTGHFLSYLGVDYEIFCMDAAFDFPAFQTLMGTLRIDGFHPQYFTQDDLPQRIAMSHTTAYRMSSED